MGSLDKKADDVGTGMVASHGRGLEMIGACAAGLRTELIAQAKLATWSCLRTRCLAGLVGAPACGDVMKLQIKVGEDGKIQDAVFKVHDLGMLANHSKRPFGFACSLTEG